MIKVLYDEDGKITEFWAIDETPNSSYIEISEEEHSKILKNNCYIIKDGILTDISNSLEYTEQKQQKEKIQKQNEIKEQIIEIETQQARALREVLLNNNEYSKTKLEEIESQIQYLRSQLHI